MPAKGQFSGRFIHCENCGKEIYKTNTEFNRHKHHFCSNTCQLDYQHRYKFEFRKCEICGKLFEVSKTSKQRFCSHKCQNIWQTTLTGEKNVHFQRIYCKCDNCGKTISIMPSEEKLFVHHFCNDDCRKQWYSNVFSQSEEWRDESRKRAVNIRERNPFTTLTKPQRIINKMLDDLNIKYQNEYNFQYYSADNYLIDYNFIIEVMGDYWHSSPLKYQNKKLNQIQRRVIGRDKAKRTYIKKYYDIDILYLWERDIYYNTDLCMQLLLLYINNNGELENYNSFNYSLVNGNITTNSFLIIPFQEQKILSNA